MVIMNIDDLREAFKAWNQEQIEANAPQEEIYITAREPPKCSALPYQPYGDGTTTSIWRKSR